ncbi:MAG: L-gulono,4-lactone dehydrogenase [Actinomycetota bacterium]|nr:L-gulono,4-lactone dehydrogenase [Actinomycetota bacterium]
MEWSNWAGNQTMQPARVVCPRGVDEIASAVKQAAADGLRVKPIGSGHSFTAIGLTDGVQLDLSSYNGLVAADPATGLVTAQAGLPLHRLNALLGEAGLGLTNMGDIDVQTVSGAVSTGTHGTGRDSAGFAAQIAGLELVLADGSVVSCSRSERPELFEAARVGLGALGVISTVTFQAEKAFVLEADERPMPLDEVLDGFSGLVADNEHFEFYWFPHTDIALTKRNNRTDQPVRPLTRAKAFVDDELLSNGAFEVTCRLGRRMPAVIPRLNKVAARALSARTYIDAAPKVFTSPRRVRFCEMEYAVPRAVLPALFQELRGLPERHGLKVSFPVEVRVAPADDVLLSTASGRDSAYIAVHMFKGTAYDPYFREVEKLYADVGGRPHWGKLHTLGAEQLRERYPRFDDFVALRDQLDPERRFGNDYLTRVLGG